MFTKAHRETSLCCELKLPTTARLISQDCTFTKSQEAALAAELLLTSGGVKGSIYWSIYRLTLTGGRELWGATQGMRSRTGTSEMSLLRRAARLRSTDGGEEARSSDIHVYGSPLGRPGHD